MTSPTADSLQAAFGTITDPRDRRGVRHPFGSLLALTFLGLLGRQVDFAAIARWAYDHWHQLGGPLGFTRCYAPHATALSRAAAAYSVGEFRHALATWLAAVRSEDGPTVAAVDGKTASRPSIARGTRSTSSTSSPRS